MTDNAHPAPVAPEDVLIGNYKEFLDILDKASHAHVSGAHEAAAARLQDAAMFAWKRKAGLYTSTFLEDQLREIAKAANFSGTLTCSGHTNDNKRRRVLHVFTEAYAVGGHSRLAYRWMTLDRNSQHDAVSTQQRDHRVPDLLAETTGCSGGGYHSIDGQGDNLLERAYALRGVSQGVDFIVIHQHPHDVVPSLAYCVNNDIPVIYMNHADHAFWVGASIAGIVAHFRRSGINLTRERRGIGEQHIRILPIPVDRVINPMLQSDAKKKLGLDQNSFLVISVGADWKYDPIGNYDYLDMVEPFVQQNDNAYVLAVGAEERGAWLDANKRTGGRIKATGFIRSLDVIYRAADVMLSPIPLGSITAMLEAASYGLPVVSFFPEDARADVLFNDDIAIPNHMHHVRNAVELRDRLLRLKNDTVYREHLSRTLRDLCEQVHMDDNWRYFLEKIYAAARRTPAASPAVLTAKPQITELDLMMLHCRG